MIEPPSGKLIHLTALLALRFAADAEPDSTLAPHSVGLQIGLCARFPKDFFEDGMTWHVEYNDGRWLEGGWDRLYACANFVTHLANLGCLDESVIRDDIPQSLTSHPKLYNHCQADGLIILFKLAGATFEKYGDSSVVDRCFELLECRHGNNTVKGPLVHRVRVVSREEWLRSGEQEFSGRSWVTEAWLGRSPSSACARDQEAETDGSEGLRCDSHRYILG